MTLFCNRDDPLKPVWKTSDGTLEPICTYRCKSHMDCKEGLEECSEGVCVDMACPKYHENGYVHFKENDVGIGAKGAITCQ